MLTNLALLLCLSLQTDAPILNDEIVIEVDGYTEINHIMNEDNQFRLTQIIVWEWNHDLSTHVVRGFYCDSVRYIKTDKQLKQEIQDAKQFLKIKEWPGDWPHPFPREKWIGELENRVRIYNGNVDVIRSKYGARTIYRTKRLVVSTYIELDIEIEDRAIFPQQYRKDIKQFYLQDLPSKFNTPDKFEK